MTPMRALFLSALGKVELRDVVIPVPRGREVLVRTGAATICTSDLVDIASNPGNLALPVQIGHEASGTVVDVGPDVSMVDIGTRVAAHPVHPCGHCIECDRGLGHLCRQMSHFGIDLPGTFADFFLAREDRVRVIPNSVSFSTAALAEPVCVSLEAVLRARLTPEDSLLIIGDGPFAVMMARLAALLEPKRRIVIAGHHDWRLRFARGSIAVNVRDSSDPVAQLISANGGAGFDAAILTVARGEVLSSGLAALRPRGRLVVFAPIQEPVPIDMTALLMNETEIIGSVNDQDLFDQAMLMLQDQTLSLSDLVTHQFTLEHFQEALDLAAHGHDRAMKVAFVFND